MPGIESKARELKAKFYRGAPKANQPKIERVIDIYKSGKVNFRTAQNVVLGLYSPSLVGRTKVERDYEDYINAYAEAEEVPKGLIRVRRARRVLEDELDRLKGVKKKFQLDVILYTDERKRDRDRFKDEEPVDDEEERKRRKLDKKRYTKKHKLSLIHI